MHKSTPVRPVATPCILRLLIPPCTRLPVLSLPQRYRANVRSMQGEIQKTPNGARYPWAPLSGSTVRPRTRGHCLRTLALQRQQKPLRVVLHRNDAIGVSGAPGQMLQIILQTLGPPFPAKQQSVPRPREPGFHVMTHGRGGGTRSPSRDPALSFPTPLQPLEKELECKLQLAGTVHSAGDGACLAGIHVRVRDSELGAVEHVECLRTELHVE